MKFLNPVNWFQWMGQFVSAYFLSVPWKEAPKSIPAVILILVLVAVAAVAFTDNAGWRSSLMASQLGAAIESDDYETVELILRRQLKSKPDDSDLNFRLAMALNEQERTEDAVSILEQLASLRRHDDSARWLIQHKYVGKQWGELSEEERENFGNLLALVTEESPDDLALKSLYSDYLIASDQRKKAARLLEELAIRGAHMRGLQAAAIYRQLGDVKKAESLGRKTLENVNALFDEDPTNTILAMAVAQTYLFDGQFMNAIRTLDQAIKRAKTPSEKNAARSAMGESIVAWIMDLKKSSDGSPSAEIDLMRKLSVAVKFAPDNPRVLTLVTDMVLSTSQSDNEEVKSLQRTLVEGSTPGISHFIMGTAALMQEKNDQALKHLKIAAELLPQSSAILNNLAVAMTTRDDADLEDALALIDQAIEQTSPKTTPHYYETRGQILYRMERFEDAIPDLLRALAVDSLKLNAHKALAVCYEKIDMAETAEGHRESVKQMEQQQAEAESAKEKDGLDF